MNVGNMLDRLRKVITLEHCVIRFIMAWCFICLLQTVYISGSYNTGIGVLQYVSMVDMPVMLIGIIVIEIVLYIAFYQLEKADELIAHRIEAILLVVLLLCYTCACVLQYNDIYFVAGMVALVSIAIFYGIHYSKPGIIDIPERAYIIIMAAAAVMYVLLVSVYMVTRYLSYNSPNYDMGLFTQMFHYMKTTGTMKTTSERDYLMSHMCVHISPVFYLILPVYMLFSSPVALEIIQPVLIALAIIPLAMICRHRNMSRWETAFIVIIYCFYPVMSGGCFYDIHENMFFPLLLSLFLLFMEKDNNIGMCISAVLVWLIKEDASVLMMFVALYMLTEKRQRKKGLLLFAASAIYCVIACIILAHIGAGVVSGRFNNMIPSGDGNMLSVVYTVLANPAYLMTQILAADRITFIIQTMGVLLFVPFMTRKWSRYILLGPYILFNLVPDYQYMYNIHFHYVFGSGLLLIYLMIINLSDMDSKKRQELIYVIVSAAVICFMAYNMPRIEAAKDYFDDDTQETVRIMDEGLSYIPDDAGVIATTFLCTRLAARKELYELYYTDKKAEYIALDLRSSSREYDENVYINNPRYEKIYYAKGVIAVFRDTEFDY